LEEIPGVVVSPFALGVKVGDAFKSNVSDADGLSDWRQVSTWISSAILRGTVLIHTCKVSAKVASSYPVGGY
jgi:hypothetical protein